MITVREEDCCIISCCIFTEHVKTDYLSCRGRRVVQVRLLQIIQMLTFHPLLHLRERYSRLTYRCFYYVIRPSLSGLLSVSLLAL